MNSTRRRAIVVSVGMLGAVGLAVAGKPRKRLSATLPEFSLESAVPLEFAGWVVDRTIVPVLPSPDVAETLDRIYNQMLNRAYVRADGTRVMLSIAYGGAQTQQLRAHRQEVCYSAQGFQVLEAARTNVTVGRFKLPATKMVARMGSRIEPVTYWFTMGENAVMSLWDRQRVQFEYSLRGLIPDGFLVRFSSIDNISGRAFALHLAFAEQLIAATDPAVAARLLGTASLRA